MESQRHLTLVSRRPSVAQTNFDSKLTFLDNVITQTTLSSRQLGWKTFFPIDFEGQGGDTGDGGDIGDGGGIGGGGIPGF